MPNFSLNSVFLDRYYRDIFERYCIRNNLITKIIETDKNQPSEAKELIREPLTGIYKLLIYLTLYEHIDSNDSIYDLSRLIELGIVPENNSMAIDKTIYSDMYTPNYINAANDLMKAYKRDIIRWIKKSEKNTMNYLQTYSPSSDFWKKMNRKSRMFVCTTRQGEILTLSKDYERIVENTDDLFPLATIFDKPEEGLSFSLIYNHDPALEIGSIKDNLIEGLYFSEKKHMPFASAIFSNCYYSTDLATINDVYYTVKVHLPEDANILPMPRTFAEVERMRKSPYIRSFRSVMNEWSSYIESGDFNSAGKMKKDIIKANKNLEHLERFKKIYSSVPYALITTLAGAEIRELSYILGLISIANPLIYTYLQRKNGWTLLTKQ